MLKQRLEIDTPALALAASIVAWDSETFGFNVAQVETMVVRDRRQARRDLEALADWFADQTVMLASCRLEHDCLQESFLLESLHFRFVEMIYGMEFELHAPAEPTPPVQVLPALAEDLTALQAIAASAFVTGRWNVDWRVGPILAGRRYADWVSRSLRDPQHRVYKAVLDGRIAGFFVVDEHDDEAVHWLLTAVAEEFQGRGVGTSLWRSMVARHRAEGKRRIFTTVSARNLPVLNLYGKLGWRFGRCQMTFHWADVGLVRSGAEPTAGPYSVASKGDWR